MRFILLAASLVLAAAFGATTLSLARDVTLLLVRGHGAGHDGVAQAARLALALAREVSARIFLATGLRHGDADPDHEEQDLVTRDFALSEVERMIRDGEIKDGTTVAALGLLRLKGLL